MISKVNTDIRKDMKKAGLTYNRLAEIMSVSVSTVYRLFQSDLSDHERSALIEIFDNYKSGKQLSL
jgi:DNA invertase Pin-like site-specific DNA recombinase